MADEETKDGFGLQEDESNASSDVSAAAEAFAEEVAEEAALEPKDAYVAPEPEPEPEPEPAPAPEPAPVAEKAVKKSGVGVGVVIAVALLGLVIGFLAGHFIPLGTASTSTALAGKTTLAENELNNTVATYIYKGKNYNITAREVIEQNSSLESARDSEGRYTVPTAENVLTVARNAIIANELEAQGITVTDEEVKQYANETIGSDDYASVGATYGMSEDQVKSIMKQSAATKKLYDKVVGTSTSAQPQAPTPLAEGAEDKPNADYYNYIVALLGKEWDANAKKWAKTDGPFYAAMSSMDFSSGQATYAMAQTAYYVAYQEYSTVATDASEKWNEFQSGLFASGSIAINTLIY